MRRSEKGFDYFEPGDYIDSSVYAEEMGMNHNTALMEHKISALEGEVTEVESGSVRITGVELGLTSGTAAALTVPFGGTLRKGQMITIMPHVNVSANATLKVGTYPAYPIFTTDGIKIEADTIKSQIPIVLTVNHTAGGYFFRTGGKLFLQNRLPQFTYTGQYTLIDDGRISDGKGDFIQNWRIKFLTSGTFTPKDNLNVDIFCVGGGAAGTASGNITGAGGGGGGYTKTLRKTILEKNTNYQISVGAGGIGGSFVAGNWGRGTAGGATTCQYSDEIGVKQTLVANGGEIGSSGGDAYVYGGNGGSGGAGRGTNGSIGGGSNGSNGVGVQIGMGQGYTTKEFGEETGALYAAGGGSFWGVGSYRTFGGDPEPALNNGSGSAGKFNSVASSKGDDAGSGICIIRNVR